MKTSSTSRVIASLFASGLLLAAAACTGGGDDAAGGESEVVQNKDCDISKTTCEITMPRCAAGQTPSVNGDCFGPCVPIAQCKPSTFACNQGGPALCEIVPPRCAAGETLTTRDGCFGPCVPSNVCKGASAPTGASADCDISKVQCEINPARCPDGQTLTVSDDGFCFGKCVPFAQCKAKSFACNRGGPALCEIVPPRCASGEVLTTRDGCFGPCVPQSICR